MSNGTQPVAYRVHAQRLTDDGAVAEGRDRGGGLDRDHDAMAVEDGSAGVRRRITEVTQDRIIDVDDAVFSSSHRHHVADPRAKLAGREPRRV